MSTLILFFTTVYSLHTYTLIFASLGAIPYILVGSRLGILPYALMTGSWQRCSYIPP